jgi:diadenosine tetraphosphate (Ap4A) HIT family hydrolase
MYDKTNIFAKIIRGEIPAKKVYEDDKVLAFYDIAPACPVHILVIPKGEYQSFDDFAEQSSSDEIANFFKLVQKIASEQNLQNEGYRILSNHGSNAGQTVPHFHVHILAGKIIAGLVPTE